MRYDREARAAGETKYPLRRMVALAWESTANFSAAPLRLATWLGMSSFLLCVALIVFGMIVHVSGTTIPGWTSMFVALLLLSGVQLVCLGLLGEYVGRIYATVQNRPAFHIGFDSRDEVPDAEPVAPGRFEGVSRTSNLGSVVGVRG